MTQEQEDKLEATLKEKFEEVRTNNLRLGALMICSAVLEIAQQKKPYNQRLNQIVTFCKNTIGKADEKN